MVRWKSCLFCLPLVATLACPGQSADSLTRTLTFPLPDVEETSDGLTRVSLPECISDHEPGRPILPVAGVTFDLPSNGDVASVTLVPGDVHEISLSRPLAWGQIPRRPQEDTPPQVPASQEIYGGTAPYPNYGQPVCRLDRTRTGKRLSVQVFPVRFDPVRNGLLASTSLTVTVSLRAQSATASASTLSLSWAATTASELASEGPYTYVIISTSNLIENTQGPYNLQTLCDARERAGFTTKIVSVEWIQNTYSGTNTPIRIRKFLQDAYQAWGVQYLLLAGTFDLIPVQKLHLSFAEIFGTRTADIPADAIYYGCMDGTFDNNGNGLYGESTDGVDGSDVDLSAEIMVGRFPVANSTELSNMVRKTLRYERATANDLRPVAHMAEIVNLGSTVYATGFMEEIRNGSTSYGLTSIGFENSVYADLFDTDKQLYDADGAIWTSSDALAFLNQNLHCVNHLGHGTAKQCMKISLSVNSNICALASFTNSMPYFMYSQACNAGAFDTPDCFAEQFVTASNAAFAAIMNARDGWEYADNVGGYSHRFHRCFWDAAFRGRATRLGEINEYSRSMCLYMLSLSFGNYWRWVYYELNLFGDPATPFASAINTTPPTINHVPLLNTYDTQTAYRVSCTLEPVGIFDPDAISLVWETDAPPGGVHTQAMTQVSGNQFSATIDPQPSHTRISYAIRALNHAGYETVSPGATSNYSFAVTEQLTLSILGSPGGYGTTEPDYGTYSFASGLVASATCPLTVPDVDGARYLSTGFLGTGSAPPSQTNQTVSFQMDASSSVTWQWQRQDRLQVTADSGDQTTQTFWVAENASVAVPSASEQITLSNGDTYAFAEWRLDGVRSPVLPSRSAPVYGDITMDAPHTLEAHYLPVALDADGNGIPDWWEIQYYGTNGQNSSSDEDGDGYTLAVEYGDRTDPRDASSVPAPPVIVFTPLAETQPHPGPFTLQAEITDTHAVASAVLCWKRNSDDWQNTAMQELSNSLYTAQMGSTFAPGDYFSYWLFATDPDGRLRQSATNTLFLCYPVADTTRFHDLSFVAHATQSIAYASTLLFNTGNADLVWSSRFSRVESVADPSLRTWNSVSIGQSWAASTNRFVSSPYSLHAKLTSSGAVNGPSVHATIALPPLRLSPDAKLTFKHWIHSEVYSTTTRAFDGGIVEYSLDNGATFRQLNGPYTHTIYGWDYSPWTNGTPCFAGNGSAGWQTITFDLSSNAQGRALSAQPVTLRFHYGADNNTDYEGWYIDDVTVSPLSSHDGFYSSVDPAVDGILAPGDDCHILWYNLPGLIGNRTDNLTVTLLSNDPVTPEYGFLWQTKLRDAPLLSDLVAHQSNTGDGRVQLTSDVSDRDGESVDVSVNWSKDGGLSWLPATLTNLVAATGRVAEVASDGTITNLLTASGVSLLTNRIAAVWKSRAVSPSIDVNTQMLFRLCATNGYFGAVYTTPPFTVDNVPPVFGTGALTAAPLSTVGNYAIVTNLLTLAWPAATDAPLTSLTYRVTQSLPTSQTNITLATALDIVITNGLDETHVFSVTALDAAGNASAARSLNLLVLNALGDFDGDGMTTADEEIAGTSATDPSDRFAVGQTTVCTNALSIVWSSVTGRRYTVETTPTLQTPDWEPLPGYADIPGTGSLISIILPTGSASRFFRLTVQRP